MDVGEPARGCRQRRRPFSPTRPISVTAHRFESRHRHRVPGAEQRTAPPQGTTPRSPTPKSLLTTKRSSGQTPPSRDPRHSPSATANSPTRPLTGSRPTSSRPNSSSSAASAPPPKDHANATSASHAPNSSPPRPTLHDSASDTPPNSPSSPRPRTTGAGTSCVRRRGRHVGVST